MESDDLTSIFVVWILLVLTTLGSLVARAWFAPVLLGRVTTAGFFGSACATFMMASYLHEKWPPGLQLEWWWMPIPFLLLFVTLSIRRTGENFFGPTRITINGREVMPRQQTPQSAAVPVTPHEPTPPPTAEKKPVSAPRPLGYTDIPKVFLQMTKQQSSPIVEFAGEFGWAMIILLLPTMLLWMQSVGDIVEVMLHFPEPEVLFDGTTSPSAYLWANYPQVYLGSGVLGLMTLAALRRWVLAIRKARSVEDMPTSTVRAAAQGTIELQGTAIPLAPEPIHSKISGTECVWYWYRVWRETRNSKGQRQKHIEDEGQSGLPVLLDDGTGIAVLLMSQAQTMSLPQTESSGGANVTNEERLILSGQTVFTWGTLESWDPAKTPEGISSKNAEAIESVRRSRYPDHDSMSSMALIRPMHDGTAVAVSTEGQSPLVRHYRFNAGACVFVMAMSLGAILLFYLAAKHATHLG